MHPIREASVFVMIFGVTLCLLGLAMLPFVRSYTKKNGPIPAGRWSVIYVVIFFATLIIAVPVHSFVFRDSRKKDSEISYEPRHAPDRNPTPEMVEKLKEAADVNAEAQRLQARRLQSTRNPGGSQDRLSRHKEATDLEFDTRSFESRRAGLTGATENRVPHVVAPKPRIDHAQLETQAEMMRKMTASDNFEPPPGPATPEQAELNKRIVTANDELKKLKGEKQRLKEESDLARQALLDLRKSTPFDRARNEELQARSRDSIRASVELSRPIMQKRAEIMDLLRQRYKLAN